jgi:hypothetical protein
MATLIAVLCAITMAICVPLVVLKPKWVFYIFLIFATFSSIFGGYINEAGNLGMPRTWVPADVLCWLTLVATFFVNRERQFGTGIIGKCLIVLALMSGVALVQGFLMYTYTAFTYSRAAHFVAAMIFGLRYFTNYQRVRGFLKFSIVLLLVMFALHVLVRFGIFTPPVSDTDRVAQLGGMVGERGASSLVPLLYLALISIALGRILSKVGSVLVSLFVLLVGIGGIFLSETRSTFGAAGVIVIASLIFMKGRAKTLIAYGLGGFLVVCAAGAIGFDFLARFRRGPVRGTGDIVMPRVFERGSPRAMEFGTIASSYKEEPAFILTGRGIGAMHPSVTGKTLEVGYYHSEYLGWLDRCGLIGLATVSILMFACIRRSLILSRSDVPFLKYYGVTCFLLIIALAADGVFHPIFSHPRGASLLICFAAIIANWQDIYQSLYQEPAVIPSDAYQDLVYA